VIASQGYHLNFDQFHALAERSPIAEALTELRDRGLLVPLTGVSNDGSKPVPVYYFPPSLSQTLRAALLLLPETPEDIERNMFVELSKVGYFA
jgi:hypothetical protein